LQAVLHLSFADSFIITVAFSPSSLISSVE
jgi:hypothetical protein